MSWDLIKFGRTILKLIFRDRDCEDVNWIELAQDSLMAVFYDGSDEPYGCVTRQFLDSVSSSLLGQNINLTTSVLWCNH
jgi:hypothetical protein